MFRLLPHLSLWARALVTVVILIALSAATQSVAPGQIAVADPSSDSASYDVVISSLAKSSSPDVLAKLPVPVATLVPATPGPPAPTPLFTPEPAMPEWGVANVDTPLHIGQDPRSPASQFVPRGSYVKLEQTNGSLFKVFYGGDGHEHMAEEGWVNSGDVGISSSPRWVQVRTGATLWAGATSKAPVAGALPPNAVLEVLEEQAKRAHVFYPGDGVRDAADGWVNWADLGPASATLTAEKTAVRLLTKADMQSLQAGAGVWLKVPYRSQLDGSPSADANCGPSTVGMALQFFHTDATTAEIRTMADRLQGTSDPDGGFAIEYLKGAVERFGLRGLDLFSVGDKLRPWGLDDVRKHLSQGHLVIPQLRYRSLPGRASSGYGDDHYVVLTGTLGDDFIYNDSVDVDGPGYGRIIGAAELKRAWGASYFPFAAFAVSTP